MSAAATLYEISIWRIIMIGLSVVLVGVVGRGK